MVDSSSSSSSTGCPPSCGWPYVRIPESCRGVDVVIGIDEAGRGPVLGPLVYAAAFWPVSEHEEISKMAFNDSKQLTFQDRQRMLADIRNHPSIGWVIEEISAERISNDMLRRDPISLNKLSYDGVIRILKRITRLNTSVSSSATPEADDARNASGTVQGGGTIVELEPPIVAGVYIDTVGDPNTYRDRLVYALGEEYFGITSNDKKDNKGGYTTSSSGSAGGVGLVAGTGSGAGALGPLKDDRKLVIEKKADATYKVVSAASIVAKVTRDTIVQDWHFPELERSSVSSGKRSSSGASAVAKMPALDTTFGSGYPSDEVCVRWLERSQQTVFGFPSMVRFSWATSREALKVGAIACPVVWECEEEDTGTADIKSFFSVRGQGGSGPANPLKKRKRAPYFSQRKLGVVTLDDLFPQ